MGSIDIAGNAFKEAILSPHQFCVIWEQVPGRVDSKDQGFAIISDTEKAALGGKVHAVSITDNPGGNPAASGFLMSVDIKKTGIEPLVHLALRDRNRNEVESLLYGLARNGVRNILAITGDYPERTGFAGRAAPVFDLAPTHVMHMVKDFNAGRKPVNVSAGEPFIPDIFAGVVFSQYKKLESELMCQYYKLDKKIKNGAGFVITQIGYDTRKMEEPLLWLKENDLFVPMIANIYCLSYPIAKHIYAGRIPGCIIPESLMEVLSVEHGSPDKGKTAKLIRAAKMFAIARGMGYQGAHIGGFHLTYADVEYIVDKGTEFSSGWQEFLPEFDHPIRDGFYYFDKNPTTGLNDTEPARRISEGKKSLVNSLSRTLHHVMLDPRAPLFKPARTIFNYIDRTSVLRKIFENIEHYNKSVLFDCMRCGDCALMDLAYLCPVSQCPKGQRDGACGGSINGWCEVYPKEKQCVWVKAYDRLKVYHEENMLGENPVPPRDWSLWQTASWLNYFGGRDHVALWLGINPSQNTSSGKSAKN